MDGWWRRVVAAGVQSAAMELGLRRIAIVNRGEAAMRLVNAVRELRFEHDADVRTIALHTRAERTAMFVRESDEAVCIDEGRPAGTGSPYLDLDALERGAAGGPRRRGVGRLGLRRRAPGVRRAVRPAGHRLRRPERRRDAPARRQDRRQAAGRGGRGPGGGLERRAGRRPRRGPRARRADRLPADDQGHVGRRRARHPPRRRRRRAGRGVRERPLGGPQGLRRRHGVHGARRHRRPPRRGPADRRLPRHGVGRRRPRLQHAAAQPEGHRGVALHRAHPRAGPRPAGRRRPPGRRRRLPERRHRRVPVPAGRAAVRVPRGQHPPPGRAPGDRADHRSRPRQAAAARRRRAAVSRATRRRPRATPSRPASTPRTRSGRSPRRRARSRRCRCRWARGSASTPASPRATSSRRSTTR